MSARAPVRVLHVITGLDYGGAERFLARLVLESDPGRLRHHVVSLKPVHEAPVALALAGAGVCVHSLDVDHLDTVPGGVLELRRLTRALEPHVVQGWLHHGDLFATAAARALALPLAWNLRQSTLDDEHKQSTRWVMRAGAALSSLPDVVVACADAARDAHVAAGYHPQRWEVIHNGFAPWAGPSTSALRGLRRELGLDEGHPVVLHVARLDPMKDHRGLLLAARAFLDAVPDAHLVCVGPTPEEGRALLEGAPPRVVEGTSFLGPRDDVDDLLALATVLVSSSRGAEGIPNVVGEALAAGVPVIATDVGGTREVLGPGGRLVPASDPEALAAAVTEVLLMPARARRALGEAGRAHVEAEFSLPASVERYTRLYEELHVRHRRHSRG